MNVNVNIQQDAELEFNLEIHEEDFTKLKFNEVQQLYNRDFFFLEVTRSLYGCSLVDNYCWIHVFDRLAKIICTVYCFCGYKKCLYKYVCVCVCVCVWCVCACTFIYLCICVLKIFIDIINKYLCENFCGITKLSHTQTYSRIQIINKLYKLYN